jgi:cystathionine beta-lyase/cystathionine gamma-synthase
MFSEITIWKSSTGVAACSMVECAVLESGEQLVVHRRAYNPTLAYRRKQRNGQGLWAGCSTHHVR